MRTAHLVALAIVLAVLALPALAQTPAPNPYDVSWASLTPPATDFSVTVLHSLFPIQGNTAGQATGNEATVIGQIVGQFTGFIAAIACAFVCYNVIVNIQRAAESSQILGNGQSWIFVVRTGFAAVMMFPLTGGFSAGQQLVLQTAMWGAGMAGAVYTNAIQAIGPDAAVIATPMIPGTQSSVAGLINSEMCMDLVNLASGNTTNPLIPAPTPYTVASTVGNGFVTYRYALSSGNENGNPACGNVTVRATNPQASTVAGVTVDMAAVQTAILNNVLTGTIRPAVAQIAQQLWTTKQSAALAGLQSVYVQGVQTYTTGLTNAATALQSQINAALAANVTTARTGNLDVNASAAQQTNLGWSQAGAYYLEIARANAATLSLLSAVPVTQAPTWQGLPRSLALDLAPFESQVASFMSNLENLVNVTDGTHQPSGIPSTLAGAAANSKGMTILETVLRHMEIDGQSMNDLMAFFNQNNAQIWTDPFGGLMQLGQTMIKIALTGLGVAAFMASDTLSQGTAVWEVLTLNWTGAALTLGLNALMSFLATPIFLLMMAMMVPGILIAYALPMIPYIIWIAGVAGWLILVCEAMIAVPLWMLAHMTVGGDGLHGRAIEGWGLLFSVLFRPVLMMIGLFLSYFVFDCMSWLVRESFGVAAGFVLTNGSIVTNFLGAVVLMNIFVMTNVTLALMSFRMIALIPHHLPRLVGFNSASRVDLENFSQAAAFAAGLETASGAKLGLRSGLGSFREVQNSRKQQRLEKLVANGDASGNGSLDTTLRAITDSGKGEGDDA